MKPRLHLWPVILFCLALPSCFDLPETAAEHQDRVSKQAALPPKSQKPHPGFHALISELDGSMWQGLVMPAPPLPRILFRLDEFGDNQAVISFRDRLQSIYAFSGQPLLIQLSGPNGGKFAVEAQLNLDCSNAKAGPDWEASYVLNPDDLQKIFHFSVAQFTLQPCNGGQLNPRVDTEAKLYITDWIGKHRPPPRQEELMEKILKKVF